MMAEMAGPIKRATGRERQRAYRERLRRGGHKRVEICIPPKVWAALYERLDPRWRDSHPGASLAEFLAGLSRELNSDE